LLICIFIYLKNSKFLITKYLVIFLMLNLVKSDALFYLPNLVLLIFVLNIDKLVKNN